MSFQTTPRILAVASGLVDPLFVQLLTQYGEDLPDGNKTVRTIGAHWDDSDHTRIRAARFPPTITGSALIDGRISFMALWQSNLAAEFDENGINGVEELSLEQFSSLLQTSAEYSTN